MSIIGLAIWKEIERNKIKNINVMMQYMSYLLVAVGLMAFLVSVITQVIKAWPGLDRLPTSAVVIVLYLVLCPVAFLSLM